MIGQAKRAARSNAHWCDAVCRARGRGGEFEPAIWLHRGKTPPLFPNAVTLCDGDDAQSEQRAAIVDLVAAKIPGEWAVKDSFAALDLAPLGFRPLFDAQWIWRSARRPRPEGDVAGVRFATVGSPRELAEWEAAWRQEPAAGEAIFLPGLLADEDVRVVAALRGERIVAGAITYRRAGVVQLSNVFARDPDSGRLRAGCVARGIEAFPGLPVCGYETGADLEAARRLGFEPIGPLRVWARSPAVR